jgi:hypothetical protein
MMIFRISNEKICKLVPFYNAPLSYRHFISCIKNTKSNALLQKGGTFMMLKIADLRPLTDIFQNSRKIYAQ